MKGYCSMKGKISLIYINTVTLTNCRPWPSNIMFTLFIFEYGKHDNNINHSWHWFLEQTYMIYHLHMFTHI